MQRKLIIFRSMSGVKLASRCPGHAYSLLFADGVDGYTASYWKAVVVRDWFPIFFCAIFTLGASPSPSPSAAPTPTDAVDVSADSDPLSTVRTITLQSTYSGASYGPGNYAASQIIPRFAMLAIGKSLVRISLPRVQTINGLASGISDMQAFYLFRRPTVSGAVFVGVSAQFPTANNPIFGTGKWLVGPAGAYVIKFDARAEIIGLLVQSAFSVAGPSSRSNQSVITVLPFATVKIPNGWYVKWPEAPWIFDLQHGSNLIPLGLGIGRVASIGAAPLLISVSDETSVLRANVINAPKNTVRLTFTVIAGHQPHPST
jgi:hypothetical protein